MDGQELHNHYITDNTHLCLDCRALVKINDDKEESYTDDCS